MNTVSAAPVVSVAGLGRRFGRTSALRGIDLTVTAGERLALLGPNGSGKSTLLRVLAGLLSPTRGSLAVCGLEYAGGGGSAIRSRIGFLGHHPYLYEDLTGEENLLFYARMYQVPSSPERVRECLALVGMEARARDRVRTYSRGMQQRLAIARAVLHDPDILLLDEPDTGLDQEAFASIGGFVDRTEGPPRTVVLATHDLPLALSLCSRFVVLAAGRVTADVPKAGLDALGLERLYWHATERI